MFLKFILYLYFIIFILIVVGFFIVKKYVLFLFWMKNAKVLTFSIIHFPNFEISASL